MYFNAAVFIELPFKQRSRHKIELFLGIIDSNATLEE